MLTSNHWTKTVLQKLVTFLKTKQQVVAKKWLSNDTNTNYRAGENYQWQVKQSDCCVMSDQGCREKFSFVGTKC